MDISPKCWELVAESMVVDMTAPGAPWASRYISQPAMEAWVDGYINAGCKWVSFSVGGDYPWAVDWVLESIGKTRRWFLDRPQKFIVVDRADDILRAKLEGKLAVSFHFQGTFPFERNLYLVELYKKMGVFSALMAYNYRNLVGDGVHEPSDAGLSQFGRALVAEMNRVGMMVDVTHTGHRTSMDAAEMSTAPIIMSHSSPNALFDHPRNVKDELIKAMAKTGGVIGIIGVGIFMSKDGKNTSPQRVFEFVDYAAQLVGPQHVGFGLDYIPDTQAMFRMLEVMGGGFDDKYGYGIPDQKFAGPDVIPQVAELMLQRNYKEDDVRGVLGGNWFRVFQQVCG